MNIRVPIVASDEKVSITQMIVDDSLYEGGWIYNFLLTLSRKKSKLLFGDYQFFWKYGIFIKRYFEVPITDLYNDIEFFLNKYLNSGYYIVCYSDNQKKCSTEKCILFYDVRGEAGGRVYYCCDWRNDKIFHNKVTIKQMANDFAMSGIEVLRCDLLKRVSKGNYKFNFEIMRDELRKGKKFIWFDKIIFFCTSKSRIKRDIVVLQEWGNIFKCRLDYLNFDSEKVNINFERFESILKENIYLRIKIIKLINVYNRLLKCMMEESSHRHMNR